MGNDMDFLNILTKIDSCRSKRETMQVFEFLIYSLVAIVIAVFPQLLAKHFGKISFIGD
jgi:hypothetical protein